MSGLSSTELYDFEEPPGSSGQSRSQEVLSLVPDAYPAQGDEVNRCWVSSGGIHIELR